MVEEFVREQMGISAIAKVTTARKLLKSVQLIVFFGWLTGDRGGLVSWAGKRI